jgi:hypothetical protein
MADLPFNHDKRSYEVKVRREGSTTIAEVFNLDGTSAHYQAEASDETLSDMKGKGHDDPLRRLQEEARDGFISRADPRP